MLSNKNDSSKPRENLTKSSLKFEWHIKVTEQLLNNHSNDNGSKLSAITLLSQYTKTQAAPLSIAELKKAISKGALWLTPVTNPKQTQRLRRLKKQVVAGDELHFYYDEKVLNSSVPEAVLIEDLVDYSVWYKPYGMLSQGSKWSDHCTIARYAQQNLPNERPAFIVHRLDRAATGLIIIAHSKKAARALSSMFELHQLEKIYHIIVHGNHFSRSQPDIIQGDIDGKASRSTLICLDYDKQNNHSLVKVKIDTGRKHQIRKHATSINMPVVGDRLHGIATEEAVEDLQLCAVSLRFNCPLANNSDMTSTKQVRFFELPEKLKPQLTSN